MESSIPNANEAPDAQVIRTVADIGRYAELVWKEQGLRQQDLSGLANTGNRFIVDFKKGKPTLQMQKALDVLDLLGLEVVVRKKGAAS